MQITKPNVALLVHSCDRYEFLFKGFEFFFSKHWDFKIPCNYYFATEQKMVEVAGFKNIQSGKGEWTDRLRYLLKEKISEKYVLYFQEDMWLNKPVNPIFFEQLFTLANEHNWKQVKLHSSKVYKTNSTDLFIEGFNVAEVDIENSDYLMSHQITLWDREFLLAQLLKSEHPWRNERNGTKRLRKLQAKIYQIDYFAENGKPAINQNKKPVLRSEYQTVSINGVLGNNIPYYINELKKGNTTEQDYALKLAYNFANHITHDGKPKPRKEDIFNKIKKWLKR